jgi:TnpA family transposase
LVRAEPELAIFYHHAGERYHQEDEGQQQSAWLRILCA